MPIIIGLLCLFVKSVLERIILSRWKKLSTLQGYTPQAVNSVNSVYIDK
jgi:hypothetical protein